MKILANVTVKKLREYSRSYGSAQTVNYPFVQENDKSITCLNEFGNPQRTFLKGTKLLISFEGTEITERAFKRRINKNINIKRLVDAQKKIEDQKQAEIYRKEHEEMLMKFNENKEVIISKVKERYPSLSHKDSKAAAFYIGNRMFEGKFNNVDLARLIRDNF